MCTLQALLGSAQHPCVAVAVMCLAAHARVRDRAALSGTSARGKAVSGGAQAHVGEGRLRIEQEGRVRKFRSHVLEKVSAGSVHSARRAACSRISLAGILCRPSEPRAQKVKCSAALRRAAYLLLCRSLPSA